MTERVTRKGGVWSPGSRVDTDRLLADKKVCEPLEVLTTGEEEKNEEVVGVRDSRGPTGT